MQKIMRRFIQSIRFRFTGLVSFYKRKLNRILSRIIYYKHDFVKESKRVSQSTLEGATSTNTSSINSKLLNNTTLITWARSDFYDLLYPYECSLHKNLPGKWTNILVSNVSTDNKRAIIYNKPFKYSLLEVLQFCKSKFVMIMMLDIFILPGVDTNILDRAYKHLNSGEYDFFSVAYSGQTESKVIDQDFVEIDPYYRYFWNTLPTFWNKSRLQHFLTKSRGVDMIPEELYSKDLRRNKYKGFTWSKRHRNKSKSGSKVMPHICSGLNGGTWCKEWSKEIRDLANAYNLDTSIRGWNY